MNSTVPRHTSIALFARGVGGVLLVFSETLPLAREGIGSATSMHALFDLLLSDTIRVGIPRWLGLFGYAPAIGGVLVMLAEAARGRLQTWLRAVGLLVAGVALAAIAFGGPWRGVSLLGDAVWVGAGGISLVIAGIVAESILARSKRQPVAATAADAGQGITYDHSLEDPDPGAQTRSTASHVLSPVRY